MLNPPPSYLGEKPPQKTKVFRRFAASGKITVLIINLVYNPNDWGFFLFLSHD